MRSPCACRRRVAVFSLAAFALDEEEIAHRFRLTATTWRALGVGVKLAPIQVGESEQRLHSITPCLRRLALANAAG